MKTGRASAPAGSSRTVRVWSVGVAATLAIAMSACGDDDSDSTTASSTAEASASEVTVTATEYDFALSATPTAETKSVTFTDDGEEPHVMVFARINEGYTLDEAVAAEGKKGTAEEVGVVQARPGESSTLEVSKPLEAGHYALLCPLTTKEGEPHFKLGQLEEFDIEE